MDVTLGTFFDGNFFITEELARVNPIRQLYFRDFLFNDLNFTGWCDG